MRKLSAILAVLCVLSGYSVAKACQCATPPVVVVESKPYTRLHNALLTTSPADWWRENRSKVMTQLLHDNGAPKRPEVDAVLDAVLSDVKTDDVFAIEDSNDFREYIEFFEKALQMPSTKGNTLYNLSVIAQMTANCKTYLKNPVKFDTIEGQKKHFLHTVTYKIPGRHEEAAGKIYREISAAAFQMLSAERRVMDIVYEKYPEKVIVDCIFNVVYLNHPTIDALPDFNFDYFYSGFDKDEFRGAIHESRSILLHCGQAALPYLERVLTELDGHTYNSRANRAADSKLGMAGNKLPDQRRDGDILGQTFRNGAFVIDKTKQNIAKPNQLLPLFLDFYVVFNRDYNTRFHANTDARKYLLDIYKEILGRKNGLRTR